MPTHIETYDYGYPAARLFQLFVCMLKTQPSVRDAEWDPKRLHVSWQVGKGWFSASFLTAESANISVIFQPLAPLHTRLHVQASSKALLDFEKYLPDMTARTAKLMNSAIEWMKANPVRLLFLSYRRNDTGDAVGRLYERLAMYFGTANVFRDVQNIPPGYDFVAAIDTVMSRAKLCIPVIGTRWLDEADEDPDSDYVFHEIATAFAKNVRVLPLLVAYAEMPKARKLPESVRPLTRVNAFPLRGDPHFHNDVTALLEVIERIT